MFHISNRLFFLTTVIFNLATRGTLQHTAKYYKRFLSPCASLSHACARSGTQERLCAQLSHSLLRVLSISIVPPRSLFLSFPFALSFPHCPSCSLRARDLYLFITLSLAFSPFLALFLTLALSLTCVLLHFLSPQPPSPLLSL